MTVRIEISGDDARHAQREMLDLLRGTAAYQNDVSAFLGRAENSHLMSSTSTLTPTRAAADESGQSAGFAATPAEPETQQAAPQRERGKPAPGRARRTKEEIAEDEAADKADAEAAAARGSISSDPENRVGPEDEPETQEQDKADEQAEVEASRDAETPLTGEDVRSAMGLYVKKFGLPATQEDGASIFLDALGTPPKGAEGWKLSVVSEQDQPTLRKAIDAWTAAANADARYVAKGGA